MWSRWGLNPESLDYESIAVTDCATRPKKTDTDRTIPFEVFVGLMYRLILLVFFAIILMLPIMLW